MYHLIVLTPVKTIFEDEVYSMIAPGGLGYLEILTDHAPIVTSLQPGKLEITDRHHQKLVYAVSGGFLEVYHNEANLLADAAEAIPEIDLPRAEAARDRAMKRIEARDPELDLPRAKRALKRAENRIKLATAGETTHKSM